MKDKGPIAISKEQNKSNTWVKVIENKSFWLAKEKILATWITITPINGVRKTYFTFCMVLG
ncbi:hypothetical protein C426_0992 [Lactococcus garvieae DCC43]|uniref:Uncharacterized protein n=1 Tax=Lactococcus garvieae DCC43 TaxID=1231377 RepID=K2PJX6_9LACT|nr:hypothetical protein C426_0992 [Lactococcus garvieae DCC43]